MSSDLIREENKIVSFALFKVEKGREKICKCNPPHYIIDTTNRLVTCDDCGSTLDAFDALMILAEHIMDYEAYQEKALEKINAYRELANEELRRRFRNKAFKDMDANYKKGMLPHCPRCGEMFDPTEIMHWTNEKYYDGNREERKL